MSNLPRLIMCAALLLAMQAHVARAVPTVVFNLGAPDYSSPGMARFAVSIDVTPGDADEEVVLFGVDVADSDAALTDGTGGWTHFSFSLDSALAADWSPTPFTGFGPTPTESFVEYETFTLPLLAGVHALGTLSVDYAGAGLSANDTAMVAITGTATGAGYEDSTADANDFAVSFLAEVAFDQGSQALVVPEQAPSVIPEVSPVALTLLGLFALAVRPRRRQMSVQ